MGVRPIARDEWERQAAVMLPKSGPKAAPWMRGDIMRPAKITGPKRAAVKVIRADRPVYDRCAAAMLTGRIWAWSIDTKTGAWLVQVDAGTTWAELDRGQVAALLDQLDGDAPAAVVAPVVEVEAETVAEIEEALSPVDVAVVAPVRAISSARSMTSGTTWPAPIAEYLDRLVFAPKRTYAAALAAHLLHPAVAPMPEDPGTEWAGKVRTKLARLVAARGAVVAA